MEKNKRKMGSHFFGIILNQIIEDKRLGLPRKFVRIFGEELGKAGLIEDPMGRIWPVEIRKAEGEIYFRSGWQQFMEYFSISVGHVLIFRYEGDSHFHVSICDKTACEIDYPCQTKNVDESHHERVSAGEKHHSMANNQNIDVPFQRATRTSNTADNQAGVSCGASKRNRYEVYKKSGGSVKRNKSDGFEENTCKPWAFNYKRHPEVVTISSDGENDDEDYTNPGDSDKHNVTDNIQENRCKPQAINFKREPGVVAINSQSSDECPVPTQHRSASHKGKCKIPKKASCAARKLDVLERKSKSAMSVIKEARSFKSEFPTCTIIMKPSHLHKGNAVHVPSEFARDFLTKAGDNLVTLKDSTGKKWHVGYYIRRVGTSSSLKVYLYKGWYGFVLDNHLKVDDACVFELVDIDNLEMKVNIIQASPDMV